MNRYSQYNVAQYDPLSMQEIIAAPLYKQKQYDALEEARVKQAEMFKIDPRSRYADEAQRIQNEYMTKVDELASYQTKTGDIQGSKSKFLDLQREYKKLNDPMGKVAQINNDKINVSSQREQYIKGATAMKFSPEAAQRNFEADLAKHDSGSLYNDKGMINQFTAKLPGNREDAIEEAKILFDKTGLSSSEIENTIDSFQHDVNTGTDFTRAVTNATSSIKNIDQRNAVVNFLQNRLLNQNSDMYKTEKYESRNINDTLKAIRDLSPIYAKNTYGHKHSENLGNVQRPSSGGDDENPGGFGLTETSNNFISEKYANLNYSDIQNIINKNKTGTTPESKQILYEATTFKNKLDKSLKENKEYLNLVKQKDNLLEKANISEELKNKIKKANNGISTLFHDTGVGVSSMLIDGKKEIITRKDLEAVKKYEKDLNNTLSKKSDIIKSTILHNNLESTDYMLTPYTKKQQGILEVLDDNILKAFQTNPENIKSFTNIESVGTDDGQLMSKISEGDKMTIAKILHNAKKGDITLNRVAGKGISGKPEYVLRVIPNDEDEKLYGDDNNWFSKSKITNKPIDIRVSFNKSKGNANVNLISGLIKEYVDASGPQGKQLKSTMDLYENYGNRSYGEFKNDPIVLSRIHDNIETEMLSNKSSIYHTMKTPKEMEDYYIKHHKDELIDFHNK